MERHFREQRDASSQTYPEPDSTSFHQKHTHKAVDLRILGMFLRILGTFLLLLGFLPARMSCKLWLNVWTCRSFTCPFTRRNLERNPTAAVISGFMVPRAQRVCIIGTGHRDDPCAFCATFRLIPARFREAILICERSSGFSWHLLQPRCCLVVPRGVWESNSCSLLVIQEGDWSPLVRSAPASGFFSSRVRPTQRGEGFLYSPLLPHAFCFFSRLRHNSLRQLQLTNRRLRRIKRMRHRAENKQEALRVRSRCVHVPSEIQSMR